MPVPDLCPKLDHWQACVLSDEILGKSARQLEHNPRREDRHLAELKAIRDEG